MLDREGDSLVLAEEIGIAVAPGVKIGAAPERLARAGVIAFGDVMDEDDGEVVSPLEVSEVTEKAGDLDGAVLIRGVNSDKGIEEQNPWHEALDGRPQALLVAWGVKLEDRLGDDDEVEALEIEIAVTTESLEPRADLRKRIFGEIDQGATGIVDTKAVEGGRVGSDAQGEIERQKALEALSGSSDHAYGGSAPEILDEPALGGLFALKVAGVGGPELLGLETVRGNHGQRTFRAWMT
jgi:hypothetical protein